jgi:hypothetical protein
MANRREKRVMTARTKIAELSLRRMCDSSFFPVTFLPESIVRRRFPDQMQEGVEQASGRMLAESTHAAKYAYE